MSQPQLPVSHFRRAAAIAICLAAGAWAQPVRFLDDRHAYQRGEKAVLRVEASAAAEVEIDVSGWLRARIRPRSGEARYTIDTAQLRAGQYEVRARPASGDGPFAIFPISIAPARNPQRFPLWSWADGSTPDLGWWIARGFNGVRYGSMHGPNASNRDWHRVLEDGTRLGLDIGIGFYPLYSPHWSKQPSVHALLPSGKPDPKGHVYPREPAVLEHSRKTAAAWADRAAQYPSFTNVLLSSEYQVPYAVNPEARRLAKAEAGIDPDAVVKAAFTRGPLRPDTLPPELRPRDGVIPDDHPIYRYLKWWWERGHGTSTVNAEMAKIIKARRPDVMVWHDPYRLAPVYGSHAGLDAISTWTYGYPDIKRLAYTTVLQAAARRERQKVMQNITLWIYGHFVMPIANPTADMLSDKPGTDPSFTQGPDYTREALWLVLSQRPDAINFYHAGRRPPENPRLDPFLTSPDAFDAIGEVSRTVIEPYGPVILQSRRTPARVAMLMSAAAAWFPASKPVPGWVNEHILPFCALLMRLHVPFEVLLDDDVMEGALSRYDALVIGRGDTLTEGVRRRIAEFAQRGKRVVADSTLRAGIPGAVQTGFDFSFENAVTGRPLREGKPVTADEHRARMEAYARQLAPALAGIARPAESDSMRVILNTLDSGSVRYVFAVNDERAYGGRFGQYQLSHEVGVRQTAKVRIPVEGSPAIYDAIARTPVKYEVRGGKAEFDAVLPPARGKLYVMLQAPVEKVELTLPSACRRPAVCEIAVRVLARGGKAIDGAMPLRIALTDPAGRPSEFDRYASTVDGTYRLRFQPGINDVPGAWQVHATDLVAGVRADAPLTVE